MSVIEPFRADAWAADLPEPGDLLTLPADLFPLSRVASMIGIAGTSGAIGGVLIAQTAGRLLQVTGSYHALFVAAACAYLVALAIIHTLSPRLAPVEGLPT